MKKTILSLCCLSMCIWQFQAQSVILLEQDTVFGFFENVDISNPNKHFGLDLFYANNTDSSIVVNWRREFDANCPAEWEVISGDELNSYLPNIHESQLPIPMLPGDSHFILKQTFIPNQVAGCCKIRMIFSLEGQADSPIDTGYYHIEINEPGCLSTSVSAAGALTFQVYPNPSSTKLNLGYAGTLQALELYNPQGQIVQRWTEDIRQLDLGDFPAGLYTLKAKTSKEEVIVKRIVKL